MKLIVLTQDQCRYCHNVKAFLDGNDVEYTEINISKQPEAADQYDVMGTPVTILMDGEEEIARTVGFQGDELETLIDNL